MNRALPVVLLCCLLGLAGLPGLAAEPSEMPEPREGETLGRFRDRLIAFGLEEQPQAEAALKEKTMTEAKATVTAQPTIPGAGDGFAERVTGTITDFLPLFQFAVQQVATGDDEEAVTVTFNPIRTGTRGVIQLQATATRPEPFDTLLEAIDESARSNQREAIEERLGDFDDVLWSARYGYQKRTGSTDWGEVETLWGRDVELYRPFVEEIAAAALTRGVDTLTAAEVVPLSNYEAALAQAGLDCVESIKCSPPAGNPDAPSCLPMTEKLEQRCDLADFCTTPEDARNFNPYCLTLDEIGRLMTSDERLDFGTADLVDALEVEAKAIEEVDQSVAAYSLDTLAELIHNQPQLVFSASYRDRDELAGPDLFAGSVRFEMGSRNFNKVLRAYNDLAPRTHDSGPAQPAQTPLNAYSKVLGDDSSMRRYTVSLSYKRRDDYPLVFPYEQAIADPATGEETSVDKVASVDLDQSEEWSLKVQASLFLTERTMSLAGGSGSKAMPRFDLSGEYLYAGDDPTRRDRLVVALSYDMAVNDTVSVPLSLVYANHAEFVGDPDHRFSAHFGISYKIDKRQE